MNRKDIRGWTWHLFNLNVEFVTCYHLLRTIALSNLDGSLVKRIEW